uniref:Uncharacterized protein n=1 Tax=Schizaphis graminum TaxID=13262 RepID=A0A2S2P9K9_SCHGA
MWLKLLDIYHSHLQRTYVLRSLQCGSNVRDRLPLFVWYHHRQKQVTYLIDFVETVFPKRIVYFSQILEKNTFDLSKVQTSDMDQLIVILWLRQLERILKN